MRIFNLLLVLLVLFCFNLTFLSCCKSDDDDDDDNTGDDDTGDDDDTSDDDDDDDDTGSDIDYLEITPATRGIPAGETKTFSATAFFTDGTSSSDEDFVFSSSDEAVLTVDQEGNALGVVNGEATITVTLEGKETFADAAVGADIFFYDGVFGYLSAYDRGTGAVTADYLAAKEAITIIPADLQIADGYAYLLESGDFAPGTTGQEGLVIVDLFDKTVSDLRIADLDNPWAVRVDDGKAYITGSLSNDLVIADLAAETSSSIALPAGCYPADLELIGDLIYVACTGFDPNTYSYADPGQVAVVDRATKAVSTIDTSQINPGFLAKSNDGNSLYVVCTGDYFSQFGVIDQIDLSDDTVVDSIAIGGSPGALAIAGNGRGFVGNQTAGQVFVFDTADNSILRGAGDPLVITDATWIADVAYSEMTGLIYAADWTNGQTVVFDPADYNQLAAPATDNPNKYAFWE